MTLQVISQVAMVLVTWVTASALPCNIPVYRYERRNVGLRMTINWSLSQGVSTRTSYERSAEDRVVHSNIKNSECRSGEQALQSFGGTGGRKRFGE